MMISIDMICANSLLIERQVSRAGTRGFRAPEVLMRVQQQTTALDIWSAGVILLCILSGRYPFFNAPDDLTALAEIAAVCGSSELMAAATALGMTMTRGHRIVIVFSRRSCSSSSSIMT